MKWRSSNHRYGAVAIAVHWVSALAIGGLLASGFQAAGTVDVSAKSALLRVHAVMGGCVLLLTLIRLAWWRFADRRPALPSERGWQTAAASIVHALFYAVVFVMVISGIRMFVLWDLGPLLFSGEFGALPKMPPAPPRVVHGVGARLMVALVVVHVGAALYHQVFRRDRLLARMGLGS